MTAAVKTERAANHHGGTSTRAKQRVAGVLAQGQSAYTQRPKVVQNLESEKHLPLQLEGDVVDGRRRGGEQRQGELRLLLRTSTHAPYRDKGGGVTSARRDLTPSAETQFLF